MFFKAKIWSKELPYVGGCGGQPLSSKSILKVKNQNPLPNEHVHAPFVTQIKVLGGNLGLQSWSKHYEIHCSNTTRTHAQEVLGKSDKNKGQGGCKMVTQFIS